MANPCQLCGTDDRAGTVEHVAEQLWESRRSIGIDPPWPDAGEYWQQQFRELASAAVAALR